MYNGWNNFSCMFDLVRQNLQKAAVRQKKNYDRGIKPRRFEADDFVWRWYPPTAGVKLGLGWRGPYKVIERLTDVTYRIQESPNVNFIVVHVDHLKPYFGEIPEKWILNESLNENENEISLDQSNYDTQNTDIKIG